MKPQNKRSGMCLQVIIFTIEDHSVQSDGHPSVIVLAVCQSGSELDCSFGKLHRDQVCSGSIDIKQGEPLLISLCCSRHI